MTLVIRFLVGGFLIVGIGAIVAANFWRDPDLAWFKWKLNREAPTEVMIVPATRGRIVRTVEAPGKIEADIEVKISALVMGPITELRRPDKTLLKEGDQIAKDQVVVKLDKEQYEADVRSAEAKVGRLESSIATCEADLEKSKRDVERARQLHTTRSISDADMADLETLFKKDKARLAMAKAELIDANAALRKVKVDLDRTTICSPINGIVSQLMAKEGEVVVIGTMNNAGTVILSISDPESRVVRARIDENNIALVREGQPVTIHLQNDDNLALTGKVLRISPKGIKPGATQGSATTGDSEAAIFETIIGIDSPPPQVRLGMNANVEIQVDQRDDALVVPTQAVLHRQARELPTELRQKLEDEYLHGSGVKDPARRYHQVVFVNDGGVARCRLVKTGISDESRVEIVSGVREGDSVIAGPYRVFDKLRDGKPIKEMIEREAAEAKSGGGIEINAD